MAEDNRLADLTYFVKQFNRGNLDVIDSMVSAQFYDYVPLPGEESAPEVYRTLAGDLRTALPDLKAEVTEMHSEDGELVGHFELTGTHQAALWGHPATGNRVRFRSELRVRSFDDGFAAAWVDSNLTAALLRLGLIPRRGEEHLPHEYPVQLPEIMLRLLFNDKSLGEKECSHLDLIKVTEPTTDVCELCVASGDQWPALRMCLVCGFVGCCDKSVNKHMRQHYEQTGHPIFRSIYRGETWMWCYEDEAFLLSRGRF